MTKRPVEPTPDGGHAPNRLHARSGPGAHADGSPGRTDPVSSDLRDVLAANLKHARENAGLSQAELARRADLSRTLVRAIEAGEQNVTLETVERLAAALARKASDLLCQPP